MEELKLIMQTLAGLGETAKEGFIWWLVIDKLVPSVLWGCFAGSLVALGAYIARHVFTSMREEAEATKAIKTIRGILGVYSYPNPQQDARILDKFEFDQTIEAVRARKEAAERKSSPSSAV